MPGRYVSIWFRHLMADWMIRRQPSLKNVPFVLAAQEKGRMVVKTAGPAAMEHGVGAAMVVADCRAVLPALVVLDDIPGQAQKLLGALAEWCLRFTPSVTIDLPDGLLLDASGCAHLWGGEEPYLNDITAKLSAFGYHIDAAMAGTPGLAWAAARFSKGQRIIAPHCQVEALLPLPAAALRLDISVIQRLEKLGLYQVRNFINMPRRALQRRFGDQLLQRLDQALGIETEVLHPIQPVQPYQERLPSLEPIRTATGIELALRQLLEGLCERLSKEAKGLRKCLFKGFRIDGNIQQLEIGTVRASRNVNHLFKLFEIKIPGMQPDLGFEVFSLEASVVEDMPPGQEALWLTSEHNELVVAELLDRIAGKVGQQAIRRYLPDEHHWPERSYKLAASLAEKPATSWRKGLPRPLHLLPKPERVEVTVPIPDYPPMLFIYKGKIHQVKKADGPERIEQEWWINDGLQRDYYCVEDEAGARYWLFRSGHYSSSEEPQWFIHGFFA